MMDQKLYIIGTLHGEYTNKVELKEVLERISPDQLLVELPPRSVDALKEEGEWRDEMLYANEWATQKGIPVVFIDVEADNPFRDGYTPETPEYKELLARLEQKISQYTWKEFNRAETNAHLNDPMEEVLFDKTCEVEREQKMTENIRQAMQSDGVVLLLTGTAHLDRFEKEFPNASLPLRYGKDNAQ